jgi:hypothetical protein
MAEPGGKRSLKATLAADMVCCSRLIAAAEEGTLARLRTLRGDLISPSTAGTL